MSKTQLAAALIELRDHEGITFAEVSNRSGVNRTTISQYVNQGIKIKSEQEDALWAVVNAVRNASERMEEGTPSKQYKNAVELYETGEHIETLGWLQDVYERRKMGVMTGYPGSGKTTALKQYQKINANTIYIEAWAQMRMSDLLFAIAGDLGIEVKGNNYSKTQQLIKALHNRNDVMILIDEAEYLRNTDKFEMLRKIWDNTGTPIVLCGTQVLENRILRGDGHENLAQLYRRKVGLKLKGIRASEAREILRQYNIEEKAAEALAVIAEDVKHGGMGTFIEILDLCLQTSGGGKITQEILTGAKRYKLMWGVS